MLPWIGPGRPWPVRGPWVLATLIVLTLVLPGVQAATRVTAGYRDFAYGRSGLAAPTAEKPESKLWYTPDGVWWGSLYHPSTQAYHIYRFDPRTPGAGWSDTGTVLDQRNTSKADALWDGTHLHLVSHLTNGEVNSPIQVPTAPKYYYRFRYDSSRRNWISELRDVPITAADGSSETLVLDRDSTGRLWVTWVENGVVKLSTSASGDAGSWQTFALPVADADNLSADDIATLVAYQGRVGVMWSNQTTRAFLFAAHHDGAPTTSWERVVAYTQPTGGAADDHINLKVQADANGRLFAVVKTELGTGNPDILVLECLSGSCLQTHQWQPFVVYPSVSPQSNEHTRPILLVDATYNRLHVFTVQPTGGGAVYRSSAPIGAPFGGDVAAYIQDSGATLNDPTTTKQPVTERSDLVVLASDTANRVYYYGVLDIVSPTVLHPRAYLPLVTR